MVEKETFDWLLCEYYQNILLFIVAKLLLYMDRLVSIQTD